VVPEQVPGPAAAFFGASAWLQGSEPVADLAEVVQYGQIAPKQLVGAEFNARHGFHLDLQPAGVTFREAKAVVIPLHLQLVSAACEEYACLLEHFTGCFDVSLVARHGN